MNKQDLIKRKVEIRPIHYLGSKLRMLNIIDDTISNLISDSGRIYDLFSGSGTVSSFLSQKYPVTSVDIQNYSGLLTKTLLDKTEFNLSSEIYECSVKESKIYKQLINIFQPILEAEEHVHSSLSDEEMAQFIDNCSIISYQRGFTNASNPYYSTLSEVVKNLEENNINNNNTAAITRLYGGIYFSFEQSIFIDAVLHKSEEYSGVEKNIIIFSILSLASEIVNTVGKHFAQPLSVRNKQGKAKLGIHKRALKDRRIDSSKVFYKKLREIIEIKKAQKIPFDNHVIVGDFREALKNISHDTVLIYADPPYTRYHYSRYYHVLETISRHDVPEITTITSGGVTKLSKGIYRNDRIQSEFSIKSKAEKAFSEMFEMISNQGLPLILSYSPEGKGDLKSLRVITVDRLVEIGRNYFEEISIVTPGTFQHSKLNRKSTHLVVADEAEILIIMK